MKPNVVLVERTIRMSLGFLLLASPLLEIRSYPFNLLGLVLIATAAVGYCPLYAAFSALRPKRAQHAKLELVSKTTHENLQTHPRTN